MVTGWLDTAESCATKTRSVWPVLPSATATPVCTKLTFRSSFRMVPLARPSAGAARVAPSVGVIFAVKVSLVSSAVSPRIFTWIVLEVSPAAMVKWSDTLTKSVPAAAVSSPLTTVAKSNFTSASVSPIFCTVKVMNFSPLSPSMICWFVILRVGLTSSESPWMVPVAWKWAASSVAAAGSLSTTPKVSSFSNRWSFFTVTETVCVVVPGANVTC